MKVFMIFVFWANQATKNRVFLILVKKECFLDQKKEVFKNSNQWKFFNGVSPWFLSNNRTFYHVCFLGKWRKKRSFFDILNKIEGFLGQKMEFWKSPENRNFLKGLDHGFCEKIELFIIFVFWANQPTKDRFFKFWTKKNAFYTRERNFFKIPSIGNFQMGWSMVFAKEIEHSTMYVFLAN